MTYDEAMEAVRENKLSQTGIDFRTVARRRSWDIDGQHWGEAVCFLSHGYVDEGPGFALEWQNSGDWDAWGEASIFVGWLPTREDQDADDWEIKAVYGLD